MVVANAVAEQSPSSPDNDDGVTCASEPPTPLTQTSQGSDELGSVGAPQKKKKKKKAKKGAKDKGNDKLKEKEIKEAECRPPVLCISRNKHWRYISSYHGPWLQLPLELLESLLLLNSDPTTLSSESRMTQLLPPIVSSRSHTNGKQKEHRNGFDGFDASSRVSPHISISALSPAFPTPKPGEPSPPPMDPGVFRSVTSIRRYIDEAAELSVRASSGLSAAELGSMRNGASLNGSPWAAAQSLGLNPLGMHNGRNVAMSAIRIHRLRALAVQKLAQAYKTDEIASSVMVMQGGSVFDDIAERVLKIDPNDADAQYVHFFHEKIPSRQLAESTTTKVLDELIARFPQRLEYYRTRGIVHCFREEFTSAMKDFTYALKEARAARNAKMKHHTGNSLSEARPSKSKRRKNCKNNGACRASSNGAYESNAYAEGCKGGPVMHPSVLPEAPEPIEPQLLFLRGAAHLQHAVHLIESAVLAIEGVRKAPTVDGAELRLCCIENGKYGGVEIGNPDGPLGPASGAKVQAYNAVLGEKTFKEQITSLLKKGLKDHEKFLSHFDSLESPNAKPEGDIAFQVDHAFVSLIDKKRTSPDIPPVYTTYHPLLVESMFSSLICWLMLADFRELLPQFVRTAAIVDGLEGYPVFLPPRSMAQAEFMEILERLAGGWRVGTRPYSLSVQRGKVRLASEGPFPYSIPVSRTSSLGNSTVSSSSADDSIWRASSFSASSSREDSFATCSSSSTFTSAFTSPDVSMSTTQSTSQSTFNTDILDDASRCTSPVSPIPRRHDATEALNCARTLLAPVFKHQKEKREKATAEKASGVKKKSAPISIPLHGPRVEVVLAWLAAVHLPELEE
ncbi:hypothetical protein EST38_g9654 [Candolleomyces aberdarensis]|uniref:Uncharacterized protein n=1 Tax=Candolleomyces aberdarensis TaxID=2316362 RepID=A0A4Q2D9D9_9AGAR|nr:hypothetical protein EST38_g9654 [Candolleomyces aberdarensis]